MTGLRAALVAAWCRCAAPYEALFVNGATRPPRTMVVSVEGRGNATLAAGEGAAFDAAPGVAVDWFEHPASAASFADRVVVASRRYVEPFDRDDRAAPRQFVFLDALHVAPCRDGVPATAPIESATYADANRSFRVDVLARRPLVAAVAGFAAPGECDALRAAADAEGRERAPRDGGLSHEGSSFRRRRGIFLPFAASSAFLARAARECPRRFAEGFAGLRVPFGDFQEPVNVVERGGGVRRARRVRAPLRRVLRPRADGAGGSGGRAATVLLYCAAPALGGATVFPGRGLKVDPVPGSALFFAYDADAASTLHAGCAVRTGAKVVASAFLRSGVSAERPWGAVDVDGVAHM
ncbi:procollagen-proline 4-dioxygenase [Aureococcus anophagefferens]|nr:procollagen-proline 4-dioxygenase [Aureococcus anophagefferens]